MICFSGFVGNDDSYLSYRIKNGKTPEEEELTYGKEAHMRQVLDVILNKSFAKFGMEKGRGETYEAMFTVSSIEQAQKYYELLKSIKAGKDELKISDDIRRALPDFPKFAITYSVTENDEASKLNQDKMKDRQIYHYYKYRRR